MLLRALAFDELEIDSLKFQVQVCGEIETLKVVSVRQACDSHGDLVSRARGDFVSASAGIEYGHRHLSSLSEPSILVHASDDDEDSTCLMLSILKDEPFVDLRCHKSRTKLNSSLSCR